MVKEELLINLTMLQQQAEQIEQQIYQADEQIQEFIVLQENLNNLKEKSQILAPVGKGVFSKAELKEDKFFVNVGSGVIVKKTGEGAVEIIQEQVNQLKKIRNELIEAMSQINSELERIVDEARKEGDAGKIEKIK